MRLHATVLRWSLALWIISLFVSRAAWAQSALERLEQQIRQRNPPPAGVATSDKQAQAGSPAFPGTKADTVRSRESAYLGLVADDRDDRGRGVRVLSVSPGSPAEKAGLRRDDLVTTMADIRVRQMSDLSDILDTFSPGQATPIEILRDGKKQTVKVTFGRRSTEAKRAAAGLSPARPLPGGAVPSPPAANVPPGASRGQTEIIPSPPAEVLPEPPEQPSGPALQPPKVDEIPSGAPDRIERLERRVAELERRVAELERALAEASPRR